MKENWTYKLLSDVCDINYGTRVVQKKDKGTKYDVYGGGGATFKIDRYNREDCFIISRFAMSPKCTRYVKGKFFLNDSGLSVSPKVKELSQAFMDKVLLANNDTIYNMGKGMAQRNLDMPSFKNLRIPMPSLEEQEKIVAELDLLTEIIDKQKQQLEELNTLAQSIFYDMFGNPVENEKGWKKGSIGSFAKCIAGATPSTSNRSYWENGTIPWLSSGEVANGRIFNTEKKISKLGYDNCSTKLVPAHTILIAMAGQGKTRGTVGITEISLCTNQSICSILSNETVNVDFIYYQLRHLYNELRSISNGDGGRGGLNLKIIQAFKLILPPKELQDVFAKKIHSVESQKESIKKSITESEKLFEYTMNKYFG